MEQSHFTDAYPGWGLLALVLLFVGTILLQICLAWAVSKIITPETGTFANAVRWFCYRFVFLVAAGIVTAIVAVVAAIGFHVSPSTHGGYSGAALAGILAAILLLLVVWIIGVFMITMKVYQIGFSRAFGFHLTLFVIGLCINIGLGFLPGHTPFADPFSRFRKISEEIKKRNAGATHASATPASFPAVPSQTRRLPPEVALTAPVRISVVINGRDAGVVTLPPGTRVKLISVDGGQLKIQYLDTVTTIPQKSTDYNPATTP